MIRCISVLALALALGGGAASPVHAASSQANCIGTYASTYSGPGFGQFVASFAQQGILGRYIVGPAASVSGTSGRAVDLCAGFPTP